MKIIKLQSLLNEQNLSGKKTKELVDAITNRHPVTFYYSGPKTPEKESVKPGVRIRAEAVAMGLSKKNNIIVRAYVEPPSVSKKGFEKHGWRTFIVNRMSNINVLKDETFDEKQDKYKEGDESTSGPMQTTYVKTDWTSKPDVPTQDVEPTPPVDTNQEPEPTPEPTPDRVDGDLPQPKVKEKPTPGPIVNPQSNNFVSDVLKSIEKNIKTDNGDKTISTSDYETAKKELYKKKEMEWINQQKETGQNIKPGEGTRKRFEVSANLELSKELKNQNIKINNGFTQPIQENINRIKSLML